MSRAFVKEDAEVLEGLPDRHISTHPNDVTQQGLMHLEAMLNDGARGSCRRLSCAGPERSGTRIP